MSRAVCFGLNAIEIPSYYHRCCNSPQQVWDVDVEEALSLLPLLSSGRGVNVYQLHSF